ncbi:hypothetical protein AB1Y20_013255 [Prymnesium parvum]|uniref:Uncharacterized protein n=1 Tax=Prymnesium parvum TaxID=97485 RepID=A0AB34IL63_PRYPA
MHRLSLSTASLANAFSRSARPLSPLPLMHRLSASSTASLAHAFSRAARSLSHTAPPRLPRAPPASATPLRRWLCGAAPPPPPLTLRERLMPLGLWAIVCLNVGAYFSQGDDGAQVLLHYEHLSALLLGRQPERPTIPEHVAHATLTEHLERVLRGVSANDTLKLKLLREEGMVERLMDFIRGEAAELATLKSPILTTQHAAKILEAISTHPVAQAELVAAGAHEELLRLIRSPSTGLYIKKTLTTIVCNLLLHSDNLPPLARAGVVRTLVDEQNFSPKLKRQKVQVALGKLVVSLTHDHPRLLASLPADEQQLIGRLAAVEAEAAKQPLHSLRATIVESGLLLYLHTAAGGAAWGFFESVRRREPRAVLLRNVTRTSLVTCFIPILVVGGVVTAYNEANKKSDSVQEKFNVYFAICAVMYPCGRLLQWVEGFAPMWLGGHIVGFCSFFCWMLYSESDILKSDKLLT